jgi:hypothetical protein
VRVPLLAAILVFPLLAGCGSGGQTDSDGDGLTDAEEERGWTVTIDLIGRREVRHVTSDPAVDDTDGDGLLDVYEYVLGGDPRSPDTDGDGLTDCQEVRHTSRADCDNPDFEGPTDGGYGTFVANADSDPGIGRYVNGRPYEDPSGTVSRPITWGDGLSDGDEANGYEVTVAAGTRFVKTDPLRKDSDGDGLEDGEERLVYGSDPTVADSDGDGCPDGFDPLPERAHSIRLGLVRLQTTQSGDVRLFGLAQDTPWSKTVQGNPAGTSLEDADATVTPTSCSTPPYNPWARVELLAESQGRLLDLHSETNPGGAFAVFLNLRDGRFSWSEEGQDPFAGPLRWTGSDGMAEFHPAVPPTQGT